MRILRDSTLAETFDENYPERGGGRERERDGSYSRIRGACRSAKENAVNRIRIMNDFF